MSSAPPTPPTRPASGPPLLGPRPNAANTLYGLQVRAFVEAAEVVDADPEVIEDILGGFSLDGLSEGPEALDAYGDASVDVEAEGAPGPAAAARAEEVDDDADEDPEEEEYAAYLQEAQTAWTPQEVKEMKYVLKEQGMAAFLNEYVVQRAIPIPKLLYAFGVCLCKQLRSKQRRTLIYFLRVALSRELESRERLLTYNTIDDVVNLIKASKRILILTGAGISVSCGIPDFRSRNGLYASLQENGEYDLDDPQQMFDIQYFRENPAVFYSFASKIYPSNFIPSPCHRFIKLIEDKGKLLRNYTQNIDTLETLAGVQRVVQCHGSFATASCINCRVRVPGSEIADDIMNQDVPVCKACNVPQQPVVTKTGKKKAKKRKDGWDSDASDEPEPPLYPPGIMKPDITFFGEKLDDVFDRSLLEDRGQVDLLIIIGTSLKVSPVSETISHLPHSVPQVLINKTPVRHINPDVVLLGNADDIVLHLCHKLGWDLPERPPASTSTPMAGGGPSGPSSRLDAPRPNLKKRPSAEFDIEPRRVGNRWVCRACDSDSVTSSGNALRAVSGREHGTLTYISHSHVWLFEGAEGGKWVEEIGRKYQQQTTTTVSESTSAGSTPLSSPPESEAGDTRQMKKARVH